MTHLWSSVASWSILAEIALIEAQNIFKFKTWRKQADLVEATGKWVSYLFNGRRLTQVSEEVKPPFNLKLLVQKLLLFSEFPRFRGVRM